MLERTFLFKLFYDLRDAGVRLDIDHLTLMVEAVSLGMGKDEKAFARLCHVLWLGSAQDRRIFDHCYTRLRERVTEGAATLLPSSASEHDKLGNIEAARDLDNKSEKGDELHDGPLAIREASLQPEQRVISAVS